MKEKVIFAKTDQNRNIYLGNLLSILLNKPGRLLFLETAVHVLQHVKKKSARGPDPGSNTIVRPRSLSALPTLD